MYSRLSAICHTGAKCIPTLFLRVTLYVVVYICCMLRRCASSPGWHTEGLREKEKKRGLGVRELAKTWQRDRYCSSNLHLSLIPPPTCTYSLNPLLSVYMSDSQALYFLTLIMSSLPKTFHKSIYYISPSASSLFLSSFCISKTVS